VILGSQVTVKLPDRSLRVGLATVLTLSGVKLLDLPGTAVVLPVLLAAGALLIAATTRRALRGTPAPDHGT
jgi:hypothetical protein